MVGTPPRGDDETARTQFWDRALDGQIHVLDPGFTCYKDIPSLRTIAHREAGTRGRKVASLVVDGRLLIAGSVGPPTVDRAQFEAAGAQLTGQDGDVTVVMAGYGPVAATPLLTPETDLPPIDPASPLYIDPGSFWVGRVWLPALSWHCPAGPDKPNPQQCIWFPYNEFWEMGDLWALQDRRESGTLFPWELREGSVPPGTELADRDGFVFLPDDWLELASARFYCDCPMRTSGALVFPDNKRDHPHGCAYWDAPPAEKDLDRVGRFQDPRGLATPALMDEAEIRQTLLEARDPDRVAKERERAARQQKEYERAAALALGSGPLPPGS